jgi:macrolide transport system ATP-binding/permease protein
MIRPVLMLIAALGVVVPGGRRRAWRRQWEAELSHYAQWLRRERRSDPAIAFAVLARASGAVPHAITLRVLQWSPRMLLQDLTFAWRMFARRPAFSAVAVAILALGIGANATIFAWTKPIVLSPLPGVSRQVRLIVVQGTTRTRDALSVSYPNFIDLRAAHPAGVQDLIAFRILPMNMKAGDQPSRVFGELVTPNFFAVLGVQPAIGRGFRPDEGTTPGRDAVIVISDGLWRRAFAADPGILGRSVMLNGRAYTVIGVAPRGFAGSATGLALDVFVPITMQPAVMSGDRLGQRGNSWLEVYGRLADGATLQDARAAIVTAGQRLSQAYPDANAGRGLTAVALWQAGVGKLMLPVLVTLMTVVGLVLLIACANLAGLLLTRATGRQREIAVRFAVGASRWHVVRQLLIENLVLAAAGGLGGLVLARWTAGLLTAFIPRTPYPVEFSAAVDPTVIAFALALTLATAILSGLMPALRGSRTDVSLSLKESTLTTTGRRGWMRQTLVVAQVALSLVLLVSASLFARSLFEARGMDPGFSTRQALLASIDLLPSGYDAARGGAFVQELVRRVATLPHVTAASVAQSVPLDISGGSDMGLTIDGYTPRDAEEVGAYYNRVGPAYFETMGIDIVAGRGITARDTAAQPMVAVINETMARRYWSGRNPVGGTLRYGFGPVTVVGVARDGRYAHLQEPPRNFMYIPVLQHWRPDMILHVRTDVDATSVLPAVQVELKRLDPGVPLFDVRTLEEHRQLSMFIPRLAGWLLGVFGALGLTLAVIGIYGVVTLSVAQRTREIGVRMALGAAGSEIVAMVLRQGLRLTAIGVAVGLGLAWLAGRLVSGQLVGVTAADPLSFGCTAALLLVVAITASLLPALRAARLDPLSALRRE